MTLVDLFFSLASRKIRIIANRTNARKTGLVDNCQVVNPKNDTDFWKEIKDCVISFLIDTKADSISFCTILLSCGGNFCRLLHICWKYITKWSKIHVSLAYVHAKARCIWLKSNFLPVIMAIEPFPSKAMMNSFLYLLKNAGKFFTETYCLFFLWVARQDSEYCISLVSDKKFHQILRGFIKAAGRPATFFW